MPGHNHYSWCMCGWCYKERRNFFSPEPHRESFDVWSGQRRLRAAGVLRSWSACFVNPNATCPICDAKVYFYQNQFGSRVFFDSLGWPWPKHPCTDHSKVKKARLAFSPPRLHPRGLTSELITLAKKVGIDPTETYRSKFHESPWDLLVIESIATCDDKIAIEARSISPPRESTVLIVFRSASFTPRKGDIFSFNGEHVAFLNPEKLEAERFDAREYEYKDRTPMLSEKFDEALVYAAQLHRNQVRKGSNVPYISHLLGVSSRVIVAGGSEVQAIAALLHDAAEDQGGIETLKEIEKRFGPAVAKIVEDCTDAWVEPKPEWRPRKEAYLEALPTKATTSLLVSLADKVDNARAILNDYRVINDQIWNRFTGKREGTVWYYNALSRIFSRALPCPLSDELIRIVSEFPE